MRFANWVVPGIVVATFFALLLAPEKSGYHSHGSPLGLWEFGRYGRACFSARSISRMSESSRNRSNTIRLPSEVISNVRIAAGLLS